MRRSNFLKLVSVVMVVVMMMVSTTSVSAAVDAVASTTEPTITISGTYTQAIPYVTNVTIVILKPDVTSAALADMDANGTAWTSDKFIGATSAMVGEGGSFEATITLADDSTLSPRGNYTILVMPTVNGVSLPERTDTVLFAPTDEKVVIFRELVEKTVASEFVTHAETWKGVLAIDRETMWDSITSYQNEAATAVIAKLADLRAKLPTGVTLADLDGVLDIIDKETYAQAVGHSIESDLSGLSTRADITKYTALTNNTKIQAAALSSIESSVIGSSVASFDDLLKLYKRQVIYAGVKSPAGNSSHISREFLDKLAVDAGMTNADRYAQLSDLNKQSVADACRLATSVIDYATLDAKFSTEVLAKPIATATPSPTPPPGGPGGGGEMTFIPQPSASPTVTPPVSNMPYNDLAGVEWAWEAIGALSTQQIFAGYNDGSFKPRNSISREEFIKIAAVGMYGAGEVNPSAVPSFTDAKSGWYAPYVALAEQKKLTSGMGDGTFGIGARISRQDMAVLLYRMLRDAGISPATNPFAFKDAGDIASYAQEAVYALKNYGIINGDPDGSFRPRGETTRAEAAVLLYKTLGKLKKI